MMLMTRGYYDLCIQETYFAQENLGEIVKYLYDYGYRTIAVNQAIGDGNIEPKKKKKKGEVRENQDLVPTPYNVESINQAASALGLEHFKALSRLTVTFGSQDVLHKIVKSPNYKKYDIIASSPTTTQALAFTCTTLEADILTFDPENKFSLRLNRKMYNQLLERGYHLELLYGPAIQDSTRRKNVIHASHLFHSFGRSRNIIISSGAESYVYIRSPYDIINLGVIFGLNEVNCRCAVKEGPRKVLSNAVGRRHGKAVMFVENVTGEKGAVKQSTSEEEDEDMSTDQPKPKKTKI